MSNITVWTKQHENVLKELRRPVVTLQNRSISGWI